MPSQLDIQCLIVLQAAASAELGIVLRTNDPAKARASIYRARNLQADPSLAELQVRASPINAEGELWIINRPRATQAFAFANEEIL